MRQCVSSMNLLWRKKARRVECVTWGFDINSRMYHAANNFLIYGPNIDKDRSLSKMNYT